jgi:DNA-binding transcriptional MerR regulator
MRIGELATRAGVKPETLRYYERRGLLGAGRRPSGFREYEPEALRRVRFIKRAQDLGFTLEEIRNLLGLWADSSKSCNAVQRRAGATLARIEEKIVDLRRMSGALAKYVDACRGRSALERCPLLDELGEMDDAADD